MSTQAPKARFAEPSASSPRRTTRAKKGHPISGAARVLLPFVVLLIVWQIAAELSGFSSFLFPRPADVWQAFVELIETGILISYTGDSVYRWALGVAAGAIIGLSAGLLFAFSRVLQAMFMPTVRFFHAIAELAFLPLLLLWFGFGFWTIIAIIVYVVAFPVLYNVMLGLERVPLVTRHAALTLGATRWQMVRDVLIPGSVPSLVAGFRIGAGYAFRALIAAEILAAGTGLGFMIFESRETQATNRTIVGMIVIGLLWLAIDRLYLRPIEIGSVERWGLTRGGL